jgi:hypothetical protein
VESKRFLIKKSPKDVIDCESQIVEVASHTALLSYSSEDTEFPTAGSQQGWDT